MAVRQSASHMKTSRHTAVPTLSVAASYSTSLKEKNFHDLTMWAVRKNSIWMRTTVNSLVLVLYLPHPNHTNHSACEQ